ncbi:MAG: hypothetical protein U0Q18_34110 [Bryobacteraceae bacterium]
MPNLVHPLAGAEPVDQQGTPLGRPVDLPPGTEFIVTIRKLRRPSASFDELWCEILVADRLYRVPLRLLDIAKAA